LALKDFKKKSAKGFYVLFDRQMAGDVPILSISDITAVVQLIEIF